MIETSKKEEIKERMLKMREAMTASHERSNRKALLEHARMGDSVSTMRDGQIYMMPPEEIFAMYDLDENGKPKA